MLSDSYFTRSLRYLPLSGSALLEETGATANWRIRGGAYNRGHVLVPRD